MSIPGSASPLFFQAAAADAAAAGPIKSLRFNKDDSAFLSKTFSSSGNRRKWTWAGWVKRCTMDASNHDRWFAVSGTATDTCFFIGFADTDDKLSIQFGYVPNYKLITEAVFRDPSAWYHIVLAVDVAQSTASDKVKVYVNGVEQTSFSTDNRSSISDTDWGINKSGLQHEIGKSFTSYLNGYLADVYFIDGSALDPTSFGAFDDNGVWQAAAYTGTYGTNGFHLLDFANEATVGHDSSGNNNDFTANNLTAAAGNYDSTVSATQSPISGYPVANGFDGSVGSGGTVNFYVQGTNDTITVNLSSKNITASSSVGFYVLLGGPSNSATVSVTATIGGTAYTQTFQNTSAQNNLFTFSASGAVTTIVATLTQANSSYSWGFTGVSVDGTYLVNADGKDLDVLFDVPTNSTTTDTGVGGEVSGNYPVLNPVFSPSTTTLSNGNLEYTNSARNLARSTIATPQSGKWYFEAEVTGETTGGGDHGVGLILASESDSTAGYVGQLSTAYGYYGDGNKYNNGSGSSYGSSFGPGDIIGCAFDADGGNLYFYKNGVAQNSGTAAFTGLTDEYFFAIENGTGGTMAVNFGARSFAYSAPSGYKTLCTTNFPTPTIADGSAHFDITTFTGVGTSKTISGLGFSPDLLWMKSRSSSGNHAIWDTIRGVSSNLTPNSTAAEGSVAITSFDSNGFTLGDSYNGVGLSLVAWTWDCGSSTASNTDGSITSSVRANQTAGCSIVGYTGTGANATVGHGLNAQVEFLLVKSRDMSSSDWCVYHSGLTSGAYALALHATVAQQNEPTTFNSTAPTSSVFSLGTRGSANGSGNDHIAYCFAPVAGFSAFGTYEGNGSSDGPFVYTGFRVAFLLFKNIDSSQNWFIYDTNRVSENPNKKYLRPNLNSIEYTISDGIDFLSNGFKLRQSSASHNGSGNTIIWAAFAENPFQANGGLAR